MLTAGGQLRRALSPESIACRVANECDTVRAIGALAIGGAHEVPPERRLTLLRAFADDQHFAVREWAWIGFRESLGEELLGLVSELSRWAEDSSERVRRYSCEVTRPRGVWCTHLRHLKADLSRGLPILERLRSDPARYVQLSVGNWLNDAARSDVRWTTELCSRWQRMGGTPELILKRGTRSLPGLERYP